MAGILEQAAVAKLAGRPRESLATEHVLFNKDGVRELTSSPGKGQMKGW